MQKSIEIDLLKKEKRKLNLSYVLLTILNIFFGVFLPLILIAYRFGIFKESPSINSWFIIGVIIGANILKNDLLDSIKELENKGWFKAYKNIFWLLILILIVLVSKIMANHLLYVLISFLIGSLASIYFEPKKASNRLKYDKIKKEL